MGEAAISATTNLADALLDDLDDLSDVEEEQQQQQEEEQPSLVENGTASMNDNDDDNEGKKEQAAFANLKGRDELLEEESTTIQRPKRKRLLNDPSLQSHLKLIQSQTSTSFNTQKRDEEEEYNLIITTNKHLQSLSTELSSSHTDLCESYKPKFPELEELILDPIQYKSAVQVLGNEMDITNKQEDLNDILNSNQIITISVAGSTTSGRLLTSKELEVVMECAEYVEKVVEAQSTLTKFVEERMSDLAPSVCELTGAAVAARLLGLAGGLAELSRIPACNLQVLGQVKYTSSSRAGMSSTGLNAAATASAGGAGGGKPHTGILAECDLVKNCPSYLQRKALKALASKLALAARCDYVNVETGRARSGTSGRKFREEIVSKIAKWEEPDKAQVIKALPKPDLTTKKRRGGKRIRRLKERFEETELMKQANKRAFSTEVGEYGDDAMGLTLGMLDTKEGGKIRRTVETKKMRQANTKASRKRAIQMSSGATSGLASSIVFNDAQGMELVNPNAQRDRVREANMKWFSDNAGFQSALPKK